MAFERVLGQPTAVTTLQAALHSGRVHHAYRFEGPSGVGKELCARAFARELIDPEHSASTHAFEPAQDPPHLPQHPDLILIGRGLYKDQLSASEATGISVEQVRKVILPRVGFAPHQGRALVFIIRDAEQLTVSAANALLKTLEEPRPQVHFVLLCSAPDRLLDTVRSRTLKVRFGPLPQPIVAQLLRDAGKPSELAALAQGSAELAFALSDDDHMQARTGFLDAVDAALQAEHFSPSVDLAGNLPKERDTLREYLGALGLRLAERARRTLAADAELAPRAAAQFQIVLEASQSIERNGQPALVIEAMLNRLRRA